MTQPMRPNLFLHVLVISSMLVAGWAGAADHPVEWPEDQSRFWTEGGILLLGQERREELREASVASRGELLEEWLADPDPSTAENELHLAIRARVDLARLAYPSPADDRFKLLFLHGMPTSREIVDCGRTFRPIEIWRYGPAEKADEQLPLLLFQPELDPAYRLWLPTMGKGPLYHPDMRYWLEQYHELRRFLVSGRRFDYQLCKETRLVEKATGVGGLIEYRKERPRAEDLQAWLQPPRELAAWARTVDIADVDRGLAALESETTPPAADAADAVEDGAQADAPTPGEMEALIGFPRRVGQLMETQFFFRLPRSLAEVYTDAATELEEYRLAVEGEVEAFSETGTFGSFFEDFRVRIRTPASTAGEELALLVDRSYRPGQRLVARIKVTDEVANRSSLIVHSFVVPSRPAPLDLDIDEDVLRMIEDQRPVSSVRGEDSLLLIPPESDLVFGLWRADVIVTGSSIERVNFFVDGEQQFRRTRPPYTAELKLARYPEEQVVRVEGLDADGEVVATDEIVINQQRGALRVRITSPDRGGVPPGPVEASALVVVPEERRIETVEFFVNDAVQATLDKPPWKTTVEVPEGRSEQDISYLTVVATLDDGSRAEEVRFLRVPDYFDEVDVDYVELYTTVLDGTRPVLDAAQEDFTVLEDGRVQELARFELVQDRPLTVGLTLDVSGSMMESLNEARRAAVGFLERVVSPSDQTFAVAFSSSPELLMPRTSDVGAVAETLERVRADGNTALHDAVVSSLYYFSGVRGRRTLVLLSDGEDTASRLEFDEALEYARRSGVVIYTIGLNIGRMQLGVRGSLNQLAEATGGRTFFINRAEELNSVYEEIERELRSQYLLAYQPDRPATDDEFREVEVRMRGNLKARTIRGYYP